MTIEALIAEWIAFSDGPEKGELSDDAKKIIDAVAAHATEEEYPYSLLSCVSFVGGYRAAEKAKVTT